MDCTADTPFSLTSVPEAEVPEFTLSCTSTGGPVRGFNCTSPDGGNIAGVASLRTPVDATNRDQGIYDHSATVTVTGNYPGVYTCQVTVHRYDGTQTPAAPEPEILVYPETPGPAQTITVITFLGELVNISLSMTPLSCSFPVSAADPPTDGLSATQVDTTIRVPWTPPSPTPYGYRIYYQAEGDQGYPQTVVVTGGSTNQKDLTPQNGVTYTVSIQTLSSTQLPSGVVEVSYQDRTSQLLAIQFYSLSQDKQILYLCRGRIGN